MTAQMPDILIVRGQHLSLFAAPLYDLLRQRPKHRRPVFLPESTALWRGYVATWEIRDGWLWLVSLDGWIARDGKELRAGVTEAFPRWRPPVRATWFSGELRCPEGVETRYVHAGFASTYERDRIFVIEHGKAEEEWLSVNPPPPVHYLVADDGARTRHSAQTRQSDILADLYAPEEQPRGLRFWQEEADWIESQRGEAFAPVKGMTSFLKQEN